MKMDKVAGSGNDEYYTPIYAIAPILKYIPKGSRVWCPFDTIDSLYVTALCAGGYDVTYTHLDNGEDFFELVNNHSFVEKFDFIISNPPYSLKTQVLEELFKVQGSKFAMLVGVVGLFESQKRFNMFRNNNFEIMYMNKRIAYFKDYREVKPSINPPFSSVYICRGILPKEIVFEEVHNKSMIINK